MTDRIISANQISSLEDQSIRVLEEFLNNNDLPLKERAALASQIIISSQQQQVSQQTASVASAAKQQAELPQVWQDWIVENKRLNIPDRTLIEKMIENGIDTQIAIKAVKNTAFNGNSNINNNKQSNTAELQTLRKLESLIAIQRQLALLSPKSGSIERREKITKEEFLEKYYATNTPVILTDMMSDWQAMQQWCPEFLKAKYGEATVEIQVDRNADRNYEINTQQHKKTVYFKDYIDRVVGGGETNDYYMVANNQTLEREEFKSLLNDITMPDFLDCRDTLQKVFFWLGPKGTITPLHHDPMNLIMAHIYGRKRWRLIDPRYTNLIYNHIGVFSKIDLEEPDLDRYPLFKDVPVIETVLEAGEIIFVPVGWWHQVKGLDVSIALSFTNFVFPNQYQFQNPNIKDWEEETNQNLTEKKNPHDSNNFSTLTNTIVETTEAEYLVDRIYQNEPLIISFGFVAWDRLPQFDFYGRTKKLELSAGKSLNRILVRDVTNGWYHRGVKGLGGDIDEVTASLRQLIEKIEPSRVITIGQSMGAYAAIMFGQLLGADKILAFGTLSLLEPEKIRELDDTRWLPTLESLAAEKLRVKYFDLLELCQNSPNKPDLQLFYGQKPDSDTKGEINLDDFHAKRMATLPNCTLHPHPDSGHAIVKYLIDNGSIDRLLLENIFA
jgi:hypothetical protein